MLAPRVHCVVNSAAWDQNHTWPSNSHSLLWVRKVVNEDFLYRLETASPEISPLNIPGLHTAKRPSIYLLVVLGQVEGGMLESTGHSRREAGPCHGMWLTEFLSEWIPTAQKLARAQVFTAACRMLQRTQWLLCVLADKHSHTGPCLGNNGATNSLQHNAFISCSTSGLHWPAPPDQETLHQGPWL